MKHMTDVPTRDRLIHRMADNEGGGGVTSKRKAPVIQLYDDGFTRNSLAMGMWSDGK